MVTTEDVYELIRRPLGASAGGLRLTPDSRFDELGLSSLQVSDIVFTVEEEVGVEFDIEELATVVHTVRDLVDTANAAATARL